ncbi:MAG: lauroyl acyltransferase [Zetaproteobacteria bacterium]|nr:MAG: lauroyl acyltransferase [Zetaproteobacteria bacterium]
MTSLVRGLCYLLRWVPVRCCGALGAGLGRLGYVLDTRHRKVAVRNLKRVYPQRDDRWHRRMARESFAELGRTLFELPHVFLRSADFLRSRVEIEGADELRRAMRGQRGAIVTAMHHSNWELGALLLGMLGYRCAQVYRPLKQPGLDRFVKRCRERFGGQLFSRHEGVRWMASALKRGRLVAMMVDQHVSRGEPVPFLGLPANTTLLPALFASKYGTPLLGAALHRHGRAFRFRLRIWRIPVPERCADGRAYQRQIMAAVNESFRPVIEQNPPLWLWTHRRWRLLDEAEGI